MGYTHYWNMKRKADVRKIGVTFTQMAAVIQDRKELLAGWDGDGEPEVVEGRVSFNGIGSDGHETFSFPPDPERERQWPQKDDHVEDPMLFAFCKTACKPYDPVVTACLAIAADVMGDDIEVSSDGEHADWEEGVALASRITKRQIPNPIEDC